MQEAMDISTDEKVATPPPAVEEPAAVAVEETAAPVVETSTPKVTSTPEAPAITTEPTSDEPMVDDKAAVALTLDHSKETPAEKPEEKEPEQESAEDIEMSDHVYSDDDEESEYEPEAETTPKSKLKAPKTPKTPASAVSRAPKTPKTARPPKTPLSRVRTGRIDKSSSPATQSTLECPVEGCDQKFIGRNPRQSLWHHLKYYATRGLPDKAEFERKHGEAHAEMKRDAEPKGTPVERNRISSSDYRKKNPEKAKTSARLSNFRARARKKGLTDELEIEEAVSKWEKEWQEKQAKEASEYFSGILLSAFE